MTNMLKEGMRAAISCQILEGDLPVTFRWERNGKSIIGTGYAFIFPISICLHLYLSIIWGGERETEISIFSFLYWNRAEVIRRIDEYSASLVIEHILSEHSGNYTCICSNVAGTERFNVQVTVNVPPKWILQPKDSSVQAGENISLHCQADGWPKPIVAWSEYTLNWPFNFS